MEKTHEYPEFNIEARVVEEGVKISINSSIGGGQTQEFTVNGVKDPFEAIRKIINTSASPLNSPSEALRKISETFCNQ